MSNLKLKIAREKTGLTQISVATKANISLRAYQEYEAGKCVPNIKTAFLIAKVLNSSVEKLFISNLNTSNLSFQQGKEVKI